MIRNSDAVNIHLCIFYVSIIRMGAVSSKYYVVNRTFPRIFQIVFEIS